MDAFVTLVYLLFEGAFNARLLDVAGGGAPLADVYGVEWHGRLLTGVALSLVVARLAGRQAFGKVLLLSLVLFVPLSFHLQDRLVDRFIDQSSARDRQGAVLVLRLPDAIRSRTLEALKLPIASERADDSSTRTFMALFPALASRSETAMGHVGERLAELSRAQTEARLGTVQESYDRLYAGAAAYARGLYDNVYSATSVHLAAGERDLAEHYWNEHLAEMKRRHIDIQHPGESTRRAVLQELQSRLNLWLPWDWKLSDRSGFLKVARRQTSEELNQAAKALAGIPPGLPWAEFSRRPQTQAALRRYLARQLGVGEASIPPTIALGLTPEQYRQQVYAPLVRRLSLELEASLRVDEAEFADGGSHAAEGRAAYATLVLPPLALTLSAAGLILNAAGLLVSLALRNAGAMVLVPVKVLVAALALVVPMLLRNDITSTGACRLMLTQAHRDSPLLATSIGWLLRAEPAIYAAGDRIHTVSRYDFPDYGWLGVERRGYP